MNFRFFMLAIRSFLLVIFLYFSCYFTAIAIDQSTTENISIVCVYYILDIMYASLALKDYREWRATLKS